MMRRLVRFVGVAVAVAFVLAGALSAVASAALPVILPLATAERKWTGKSDGTVIELVTTGGETVSCESAPASGTEEKEKPLGLFHIEFRNCKLNGVDLCTGLGDPTNGVILSLGTWHLVFDQLKPELLTATLFLLETVHFTCELGIPDLVEVSGTLVCLDLEATVKKFEHLFHCNQSKGVQSNTVWFNEAGTEQKAALTCNLAHISKVGCAELALGTVKTEVEVFADI
jgi:hypothetical protein